MIFWNNYPNFSEKEFACPCCGICNVSPEFLNKLQAAREIAGVPFIINSGCRCPKHNKEVGGKEHSAHITTKYIPCFAADIRCITDRRRFILIQSLIDVGFKHIGIDKEFIHVDDDFRKAIWLY